MLDRYYTLVWGGREFGKFRGSDADFESLQMGEALKAIVFFHLDWVNQVAPNSRLGGGREKFDALVRSNRTPGGAPVKIGLAEKSSGEITPIFGVILHTDDRSLEQFHCELPPSVEFEGRLITREDIEAAVRLADQED